MSYPRSYASMLVNPRTPGAENHHRPSILANCEDRIASQAMQLLTNEEAQLVPSTVPATVITGQFEKLFENDAFDDAVLNVEDKTIKVNRAVLASRSPVFYFLFLNKHTEVNIGNVDYETLKVLVEYIYRDRIQDISKLTLDVLIAAGKYSIPGLAKLAEDHLVATLTKENIEQMLIVAKQHNLVTFMNRCIKYTVENCLVTEIVCKLLDRLV